MDRQEMQQLVGKLKRRLSRELPQPMLVYGRRAVKAPGFSLTELAEAGLDQSSAGHLGLPVDNTRMSSLGANVDALVEFLKR
jgi:ribosomal protein L13E